MFYVDLRQWHRKDLPKGDQMAKQGLIQIYWTLHLCLPHFYFYFFYSPVMHPIPGGTDGEELGGRHECCSAHKPFPTLNMGNVGMCRMVFWKAHPTTNKNVTDRRMEMEQYKRRFVKLLPFLTAKLNICIWVLFSGKSMPLCILKCQTESETFCLIPRNWLNGMS